ncbi:hypothetical protein AB1Y20_016768 [Prymnesium parvum]|uniref:Calmodulin n=1 Tax=Prymnesium parvum TaxID=97485 RepID=A0AB34I8U6_PRYPA
MQFVRARRLLPAAAAAAYSTLSSHTQTDCFSFGVPRREKSLDDALQQARLAVGGELGAGAFATVHLVRRQPDGERFALKLVDKARTPHDVMQRELHVLRVIGQHQHVVSMVDFLETPNAWGVLLDLVTGGEVFERICADGAFSEQDAAALVRQVALALKHVHAAGVCHRDLKPENLLLCSPEHDAKVKLCDFGLAAFYGEGHPPMEGRSGTVGYMAPEQLRGLPYGPEVDLWAVGVILYILLSGFHPFDPDGSADDDALVANVLAHKVDFTDECWRHVSAGARDVICGLLHPDPSQRTTADQLLSSPWVCGHAAATPLPGSDVQLKAFNQHRATWRAAIRAAALVAQTPSAASHHMAAAALDPSQLSDEARAELRAAFETYDRDGNGSIELDELRLAMHALGGDVSAAEEVFRRADRSGNHAISFDEFCAAVGPLYSTSEQALRNVFRMFDTDGSGTIDQSELRAMLSKLRLIKPSDDAAKTVEKMFAAADTNGDGSIDFHEFVGLFAAKPDAA